MCHGVPAQSIFDKYLNEYFDINEIKDIKFRDKTQNGWSCTTTTTTRDGNIINNQDYFDGFNSNLYLRQSCYSCKFARTPRVGDITLGDFWSIGKFDKSQHDSTGVSMVLLNNEKGRNLFNEIKDSLEDKKEQPYSIALKTGNCVLYTPSPKHPKREDFFRLIKNHTFKKTYDIIFKGKYDMAVVGCGFGANYGAVITNWALIETLKDLNWAPVMVDKVKSHKGYVFDDDVYKNNFARRFMNKYIEKTPIYNDIDDLSLMMNNIVDTFIIGSDQVWNRVVGKPLDNFYFLDWVYNNKRKISYGTSFGHGGWNGTDDTKEYPKYLLKKFDFISVREDKAKEYLKNEFQIESTHVLDPVFCVDKKKYDFLVNNADLKLEGDYIASYLLDLNRSISKAVNKSAHDILKMNLNCIVEPHQYFKAKRNLKAKNIFKNLDIENFLYIFKNSKFVITNSFHGLCFAIIFKKPFICIVNSERGAARFESILKMLNLQNRMVYNPDEIPNRKDLFEEIDYEKVYKIIDERKEFSLNWLKNAIETPINKEVTDYDVLLRELYKRDKIIKKFIPLHNFMKNIYSSEISVNKKNQLHRHIKILGIKFKIKIKK